MIHKAFLILVCAAVLLIAPGCTKQDPKAQLIVEIPAGFTGNCVLEMGNSGASSLARDRDTYVVTVPRSGRVTTSTLLDHPKVVFKNAADGKIWGYSESVFTTGDGIAVGGKIEFFVGTQKDFEAEQDKKNHSRGSITSADDIVGG